MQAKSRFKKWYSVTEAATALSQFFEESITVEDVLIRINEGSLPAYWDASNRYAVALHRASAVYFDPADHPLFAFVADPSEDHLVAFRRGMEDFFASPGPVEILRGQHRLMTDTRDDAIVLPYAADRAEVDFAHGLLLLDDDHETILKVLKRLPDAPPFSLDQQFFVREETMPTPEELRVSATDLHDLIGKQAGSDDPISDGERDKLLRQIGALAMVLAEKNGRYLRGGRPNISQIATAVAELIDTFPDAAKRGLKSTDLRNSIAEGINLIKA